MATCGTSFFCAAGGKFLSAKPTPFSRAAKNIKFYPDFLNFFEGQQYAQEKLSYFIYKIHCISLVFYFFLWYNNMNISVSIFRQHFFVTERARRGLRRGIYVMFSPSDYGRVWESILGAIRESGELSTTALDFWFRNVKVVYIDEESVVFSVENELKKDNILERYAKILAICTMAVVGGDPTIELIVERAPATPLEGEGRVNSPLSLAKEIERERKREKEENLPPYLAGNEMARQKNQAGGGERRLSYNPEYTFDNFIVGNSNKFAHAAALAVAKNPASTYNPLFLYGPSGLGKTHLMYAITNKLFENSPDMNAIYINGEDFTNQLIESISRKENAALREKYRKADILLIDDIQFIAGKESTQEEFFHTFNALYSDHKQIILTSDRPPKEMVTLEDRIRSRFEQGLIVDIHQPDYELRLAILKNKAKSMNLVIGDDVLAYIAEKLHSNIRQLEGIIKRISATHLLDGAQINMDLVRTLLPMFQQDTEPVGETAEKIIAVVAKRYGVTSEDVLGVKRTKNIKNARNIAMYIIRQVTDLSLNSIGVMFERDHSTIHSNITAIEKQLKTDAALESEIADIRREIKK